MALISQELFSNDYKKVSGIDIFSKFQNFVSKYLFKEFVEFGYHAIRQ